MKASVIFLLAVLLSFFYTGSSAQKIINNRPFIWGVNGHSVTPPKPYDVSIDTQLAQIKSLGFTRYRNDVTVDTKGQVLNAARFKELLTKAQKYKIKILPMIYDPWDPNISDTENYARGYAQGLNFAKLYGSTLSEIEIGNERDLSVLADISKITGPIKADGQETSHYDRKRANSLAACFKGMADGIHKARPRIKVIVDCSNHPRWGFFKILQEQKVPFDIVALHWYTSSGPMTNVYGQNGIKELAKFKKPIWITEINRGGGTFSENEIDNQSIAMGNMIREVYPYKEVQAFLVYELYDNEKLKSENNPEGFFGIYYTPDKIKPAASVLRNFIHKKTSL